jgi:hypothetical protein
MTTHRTQTGHGLGLDAIALGPAGPPARPSRARRRRLVAWIAAASLCLLGAGTLSASVPAGATGVLQGNPSANVAPSSSDWLSSIDAARASEGLGPMALDEASLDALPVAEQIFVVINQERIARGLAPVEYMSAQLNAAALAGAKADDDPSFPAALSGGTHLSGGGAIWAGGITSALEADYYWMYSDGWGGTAAATSNTPCTSATSAGCWGHRDVIVTAFPACAGGVAPTLVMGAGSATTADGTSMAALMVSTCGAAPTDVTLSWSAISGQGIVAQKVVGLAATPNGLGYWAASSNGAVSAAGDAPDLGSMAGQSLNSPIVGIAATPDGGGYWLVAADGGIFSFGDARFFGSTGALVLNAPIVGMAATPDGGGYWMVAADGGIFSFGDARFLGSMGATRLNQPIVAMTVDPATGGYWLVAADGGIFSFDAPFFGSTGALRLNKPIVGIEALANGAGYRFVASDGGVFCFGGAAFDGSAGAQALSAPVSAMAPEGTGGYWLAGTSGTVYNFGGAAAL